MFFFFLPFYFLSFYFNVPFLRVLWKEEERSASGTLASTSTNTLQCTPGVKPTTSLRDEAETREKRKANQSGGRLSAVAAADVRLVISPGVVSAPAGPKPRLIYCTPVFEANFLVSHLQSVKSKSSTAKLVVPAAVVSGFFLFREEADATDLERVNSAGVSRFRNDWSALRTKMMRQRGNIKTPSGWVESRQEQRFLSDWKRSGPVKAEAAQITAPALNFCSSAVKRRL